MAVTMNRSQRSELLEGATDGKYKKVVQDRGGVVDQATYEDRIDLSDTWYGIHEAANKVAPDGTVVHTENYVRTAPVGIY